MKKIYLLFILSILSLNLYNQSLWTKHPGNPVLLPGAAGAWDEGNVGFGSVIYHNNIYHMWYTGGESFFSWRIGHATSPDGITWTKDPSNPVLTVGSPGSWDESMVAVGEVLVINNTFHMWYTGWMGSSQSFGGQIGHATSPDGITWTKDPNNPVLKMGGYGTWDFAWVEGYSVIFDGTKYHIWYAAYGGTSAAVQIGHATSPDGLTWTKDPLNPVLTVGSNGSWDISRVESPCIVFDDTTFHMWYNGGQIFNWKVGYAKSVDGSIWTKYPSNPVLDVGQAGTWDSKFVWVFSVMDAGVKYRMWYSGDKSGLTGSIGYAESDSRIPYLFVKSKTFVGKTDTLAAEINKDGIIYIVPKGTSLVNDSINKYKVSSVDTLANAEVHIPLKDLSYGQYLVVAVSNGEFVSPDPFLLKVVPDPTPPVLTLAEDTVSSGVSINVTSTKDGMLYLLNSALPPDLSLIRNPNFLVDSLLATTNVPVEFSTAGISVNKSYYLYVVDIYGIFSDRGSARVESIIGVKDNVNTGIRIYPNPFNDLLTVETDNIGQCSIEITSMNGQLIYRTTMDGDYKQIDLSSFHKGVYFLTIRSKDFVRTEKIIRL